MEWVASTLTPPANVVYPALLKLMRTPRLPAVDWTDAPTDLNGLVRFGKDEIWFLRVCHHVPHELYLPSYSYILIQSTYCHVSIFFRSTNCHNTEWSKSLCAPDDYNTYVRCTETFWSPCSILIRNTYCRILTHVSTRFHSFVIIFVGSVIFWMLLSFGLKGTCRPLPYWLCGSVSLVFLNRRAAARYRALASIIPDRERFSWNLSF